MSHPRRVISVAIALLLIVVAVPAGGHELEGHTLTTEVLDTATPDALVDAPEPLPVEDIPVEDPAANLPADEPDVEDGSPDTSPAAVEETEETEAVEAAVEAAVEPTDAVTTDDNWTSRPDDEATDPAEGEGLATPDHVPGPPAHVQQRRAERLAWDTDGTTASLSHVAHVIGADQGWANRYTGAGVGVALIDTGVVPVAGLQDVIFGPDLSWESQADNTRYLDAYGHGTHLAGIITSDRSDARGIAPDADLMSIRVGASNGAVDVSQVIAAVDWVAQHGPEHGVRVLVLPFGTDGVQDAALDPLSHAVESAWRAGITVVVSAGNRGESRDRLNNPARNPFVISVAAADTAGTTPSIDDGRPAWSAPGDGTRRPDITAPGVGIVSQAVPGGYLSARYPSAARPGDLFRGSGTSQAAAVVAASAALLLEARPELTPDEVKAVLQDSARPLRGQTAASGAGMLSIKDALRTLVPSDAAQTIPHSTGTGLLEGSRGSHHLVSPFTGQLLAGEIDVRGQTFDSAAWAPSATQGTTWDGGHWNSSAWTGDGWVTAPLGASGMNGISWDGISWDGISWDGISWDGISWDGISWDGISWDGISWDGISWDSVRWD